MIFIDILVFKVGLCYALYEDRNGDKHPNHDWVAIGIVILASVIAISLIHQLKGIIGHGSFDWEGFIFDIIKGCSLAIGDCIILFPWAVSLMMIKRKIVELPHGIKWYNHFSQKAIPDKWKWWQRLHWSLRALAWAILASPLYFLYYLL